jgi:hypothetical protein
MWAREFPAKVGLMLKTLMDLYPVSITKEQLGDKVGVDAASSTFRNYFSMLRSNGLATSEPRTRSGVR